MAGPDLKEKEVTSNSVADSEGSGDNDRESWSPADDAAYQSEYDKSQQQKKGQGVQRPTGKTAKQMRADAWKKKRNQLLKKVAEQAIERGADEVAPGSGKIVGTTVKVGGATVKGAASGDYTAGLKELEKELNPNEIKKTVWGWLKIIVIAIVVGFTLILIEFLFIIAIIAGILGKDNNVESTLTITLDGPASGTGGECLTYFIHAVSSVPTSNIILTDKIPQYSHYVSPESPSSCRVPPTDGQGIYNPATNTVTWNTKNTPDPADATYTLTIQLDQNLHDTKIINFVTGSSEDASGYVSSTRNTCGGKYDFSRWPEQNPLGNFGDPLCNYTTDKLSALISQLDPVNKHWWYDIIILHETAGTYSPNAFSGLTAEQCQLDCGGAWGLYQMGSSTPAGQTPPAPGKNGIYDRGDVNWELQTANAINFNEKRLKAELGCYFWYWRSARDGEIGPAIPCP